jgi:uncharacterized protein with von Willebrand factor type A (vWA) domain
MLLLTLLFNLRGQGVRVGTNEWLALLRGLEGGLAEDLDALYFLARAVLVHTEAHYDAFDVAFKATFDGVELPPQLKDELAEWLAHARQATGEVGHHDFESLEAMRKELEKRLREQTERHDGGNRWVGTGGTSPFGNSGRADQGIRVGGGGGGRSAVQVAGERRWQDYRTDLTLDVRDFKTALATLRRFGREGEETLDLPETIERTAGNAGEIEIAMRRERVNRVRLLLLMDSGGSMEPYAALVSRLFSAASEMKTFKTFEAMYFHNCPYGWLFRSYAKYEREKTAEVIARLTPQHRVIWVGDASMAPWELFQGYGWGEPGPTGMDWIRRFAQTCPRSVWLNPDPKSYWNHPTVSAIGASIPMFHLSVAGLRDAMKRLRAAA